MSNISNSNSRVDLVNNILDDGSVLPLALKQGCNFEMTIKYPGDISLGTPTGQIRDASVDDNGQVLGDWSFPSQVYDPPPIDQTSILCQLDSIATSAIPETKYQFTDDGTATPPPAPPSEKNCWVYDIKTTDNSGKCIRLIDYGLMQILSKYSV